MAATANINATNTTLVQNLLTVRRCQSDQRGIVADLPSQYHVLPGYYPASYFPINQTSILNTALNQNLVFTKNQFGTTLITGGQNATVLANSTVSGRTN